MKFIVSYIILKVDVFIQTNKLSKPSYNLVCSGFGSFLEITEIRLPFSTFLPLK
jgi:hypothetical protein